MILLEGVRRMLVRMGWLAPDDPISRETERRLKALGELATKARAESRVARLRDCRDQLKTIQEARRGT